MNDEIHPMFQDIWRVFYFRCRDCDISIKLRSQEDLKSKDIVCPKCQNNNIRHVKTTTSAFGSIDGNVGYVSFEKQSDLNIKSEGREKVVNIIKEDPILKGKINPCVPWWRDGSVEGTERKEKVLTLKEAGEVKEKIKHIEANLG